jgi:hypothetical protein
MTLQDLSPAPTTSDTHAICGRGHTLSNDQTCRDNHIMSVVADLSATDHRTVDTQSRGVGGDLLPAPSPLAAPTLSAALAPSPTAAICGAIPTDPALRSDSSSSQPSTRVAQTQDSTDGWLELRLCADLFDRAQTERISTENIIRTPLKGGNVDPAFFTEHMNRLTTTEHQSKLMLRRCYKRVVPATIRAWETESTGIGLHLIARLLGRIGTPNIAIVHYWEGTGPTRTLMEEPARPRTIGQLWQLCGHGDPTRRMTKGMTAEQLAAVGNPHCKMIVHLLAESAIKEPGRKIDELLDGTAKGDASWPYRIVYEHRRLVTVDRLHAGPCVRCGPSGKPALEGTPWSKGHQHGDGLRIVGKELLRDLWKATA